MIRLLLLKATASLLAFIQDSKANPRLAHLYTYLDLFRGKPVHTFELPNYRYDNAMMSMTNQNLVTFDIKSGTFSLTVLGRLFQQIRMTETQP